MAISERGVVMTSCVIGGVPEGEGVVDAGGGDEGGAGGQGGDALGELEGVDVSEVPGIVVHGII